MNISQFKPYSPNIVRIGICIVFLWFGLNQIFLPNNFAGYLPSWILQTQQPGMMQMMVRTIPGQYLTFIRLNGLFELIFVSFLLVGKYVRTSALILSLHLAGIALSLGYNDVMIRDVGLTIVTFSIALHGPDSWCIDGKNNPKKVPEH